MMRKVSATLEVLILKSIFGKADLSNNKSKMLTKEVLFAQLGMQTIRYILEVKMEMLLLPQLKILKSREISTLEI